MTRDEEEHAFLGVPCEVYLPSTVLALVRTHIVRRDMSFSPPAYLTSISKAVPNDNKKLFNIRKKGDIDYPVPDCCKTECYPCARAHYCHRQESSLAEEYKRLLDNEKKAMSSTITAVEELENEQATIVDDLNAQLEAEREKNIKYAEDLEHERKLRLTQVYRSETEKRELEAEKSEAKLALDRMLAMQEELETLRVENRRLLDYNDSLKEQRKKSDNQLQSYEMDIYRLEQTNADLRLRLTRR